MPYFKVLLVYIFAIFTSIFILKGNAASNPVTWQTNPDIQAGIFKNKNI